MKLRRNPKQVAHHRTTGRVAHVTKLSNSWFIEWPGSNLTNTYDAKDFHFHFDLVIS